MCNHTIKAIEPTKSNEFKMLLRNMSNNIGIFGEEDICSFVVLHTSTAVKKIRVHSETHQGTFSPGPISNQEQVT